MAELNILSLIPIASAARERIAAIDPSVRLVMAPLWFDGEIRETWPEYTARSYMRPDSTGQGTREERDTLLAEAEIVIGGFPFPLDLRARAPRLKWFHQTPAGASNLLRGDLWGSDVVVTTSRGLGNTLAMAEWTVACFLHFARDIHLAEADRVRGDFDRLAYKPIQLAGKTVCVVGAGGIGQDVGRLCAALGMRVTGTRRSAEAPLPEGFSDVRGPEGLHDLLAEADFVAVCCQWTPETEGLIGREALAAMKEGAVLTNVARGEIIDEAAVKEVLAAGKLRGVGLDVYVGEFEHLPDAELWADPRVLFTPHVGAGTDIRQGRQIDLFCDNLRNYIAGKPLENVLDWERGY